MRITPLDIIQVEFTPSRKGVDSDEVRAFLEKARETLEEILKENYHLRETLASREEEIRSLRQHEAGIKETLVLARQLAGEARKAAQREADLVVGEARIEAERILMATQEEHRTLVGQVTRLRVAKAQYAANLRALIETQIRLLNEIEDSIERQDPNEPAWPSESA